MKITKNELIEHYNFYVEDEEENGNQPLSYDEWNEEYLDDLLSVLNKMKAKNYKYIYLPSGDYLQIKFDEEGIVYDRFNEDDEHQESYGYDLYEDVKLKTK